MKPVTNCGNETEEIRQLLHKLAEYELSGLTPDEVISFTSMGKGKIVAELKQVTAERDALLIVAELKQVTAERDALLIVAELKQVTAERDALLADYEEVTSRVVKCPICKNYKGIPLVCGNIGTASCKDYAWRGVSSNNRGKQ